MKNAILSIRKSLSNIRHNIMVYETMPSYKITEKDREKTLSDLKEMATEYEDAMRWLKDNKFIMQTLESWKAEHEGDYNKNGEYRCGYVKAMNDVMNFLIKKS